MRANGVKVQVFGKVLVRGCRRTGNKYDMGTRPGAWAFWFDDPVTGEHRRVVLGVMDAEAAKRQAWAVAEVVFGVTREAYEAEVSRQRMEARVAAKERERVRQRAKRARRRAAAHGPRSGRCGHCDGSGGERAVRG